MFAREQLDLYVKNVKAHNGIDIELKRIEGVMVEVTKSRSYERIGNLTQMFQALLAEKARQEAIDQMRNHYRRNAQNTGASPAHDTGAGVGIRDILKK